MDFIVCDRIYQSKNLATGKIDYRPCGGIKILNNENRYYWCERCYHITLIVTLDIPEKNKPLGYRRYKHFSDLLNKLGDS